jgi:hypothetical protein
MCRHGSTLLVDLIQGAEEVDVKYIYFFRREGKISHEARNNPGAKRVSAGLSSQLDVFNESWHCLV